MRKPLASLLVAACLLVGTPMEVGALDFEVPYSPQSEQLDDEPRPERSEMVRRRTTRSAIVLGFGLALVLAGVGVLVAGDAAADACGEGYGCAFSGLGYYIGGGFLAALGTPFVIGGVAGIGSAQRRHNRRVNGGLTLGSEHAGVAMRLTF